MKKKFDNLTSIGRILNLIYQINFNPTTKQSQGFLLTKLLPTEKIVSCCPFENGKNIYLVSKQGKIFYEIVMKYIHSMNTVWDINEKIQLENDDFLKILPNNHFIDIETNKNKSARLNCEQLNFKSNKTNYLIDFLKLETDDLENCFRLKTFLTKIYIHFQPSLNTLDLQSL